MTKHVASSFIIGVSIALCVSSIYSIGDLIIPTTPADHNAHLHTLHLGTETLTLNQSDTVLVVRNKLIAGDVQSNNLPSSATFGVIGGGAGNSIADGAQYAVIGAGRLNTVSSPNATIGA